MNEMKKDRAFARKQAAIWILSLLPLVLAAAVYRSLPAQIPTNWGIDGEVSYGSKNNIWIIAGMSPFLAGMFQVLPMIDPKRKNYSKFPEVYQSFQLFMQVFQIGRAHV